ncbi:hypothetical protein Tco_1357206 [Tanacetum coccineum]
MGINHGKNSERQQNKSREVVSPTLLGQETRKGMLEPYPTTSSVSYTILGPVRCKNCKKVGHMPKDYWSPIAATRQRTSVENRKATVTCYECGK